MSTIAVLGAGNGGLAAAADLTLRGHEVQLFARSSRRLAPIRDAGYITLDGAAGAGRATVSLLTTDLTEAVDGAELIMATIPSTGIRDLAAALAPCLQPDQPVFLNPGGTGGALSMAHELQRAGFSGTPLLGESSTLTYACRADETGAAVHISNVAPAVPFAAFPGSRGRELWEQFSPLYPGLSLRHSVLETGMANINAVEHPPQALLNTGWIEHTKGDFYFYLDGTTPGVGRVIDGVDAERQALARALDVPASPFVDIFHAAGYTTADAARTRSAHAALQASEANRHFRSPPTMDHRYVHEDVGHGLVPWALWARIVGTPTPLIDSLIRIASAVNGRDYLNEGLTLERMGLNAVTKPTLHAYLHAGTHEGSTR